MVLCRYCGKEMRPRRVVDLYDAEYYCDCEDYVKDEKLNKEIARLGKIQREKSQELYDLRSNSKYCSIIREYQAAIKQLKETYSEGGDWI